MDWFSTDGKVQNSESIWSSIQNTLQTTRNYLLNEYDASVEYSVWRSFRGLMSQTFGCVTHILAVIFGYLYELYYASCMFLLGTLAVVLIVAVLGVYLKKKRSSSKSGFRFKWFRSRNKNKATQYTSQKDVYYGLIRVLSVLVLSACVLSIPWEFVRQYHLQYAKQAAITLKGLPPECDPATMTYVTSVRHWLRSAFSWSQDPCIEYHQALLVHPLAEISPSAVVSGALTRFVIQPVLVLSETLPTALRNVFSELPLHWQPFFFFLLVIITVLFPLLACRYKIRLPFVSFEPASPPTCNTCNGAKGDGNHVNRKDKKLAIQESSFKYGSAVNGLDSSLSSPDSSALTSDDSYLDPSYKPSAEVNVKPRSGLKRLKGLFTSYS